MIKVTFFKKQGNFTGFEISGHSGFAEEGSDIVCSAVSSVAYMVANTLTEVSKVKADIVLDDGYLKFDFVIRLLSPLMNTDPPDFSE